MVTHSNSMHTRAFSSRHLTEADTRACPAFSACHRPAGLRLGTVGARLPAPPWESVRCGWPRICWAKTSRAYAAGAIPPNEVGVDPFGFDQTGRYAGGRGCCIDSLSEEVMACAAWASLDHRQLPARSSGWFDDRDRHDAGREPSAVPQKHGGEVGHSCPSYRASSRR